MKKRIALKCFALFLTLVLIVGFIPNVNVVNAVDLLDVEISSTATVEQLTANSQILKYVDEAVLESNNHVRRLEEDETLSSYVFLNCDGTKTVYYTYEEVKYQAADGTMVEKDISLVNTVSGYTTASNDVELALPNDPANGISISYLGYDVTLAPLGGALRTPAQNNGTSICYPGYFGTGTLLVYTPTLSGLKEDIVLAHYTGINTFSFRLETDGLNLYLENERYYLAESEEAEMRIEMGDIVSFDACGKFSIGTMTVETVTAGEEYILTLTVDENFLTDESTVYPVSIDPTLTVSDNTHGAGAIEDVTIYSGRPNVNGNWTYSHCGYYDDTYRVARTLVRLTALKTDTYYTSLPPYAIESAKFHIREATGTARQYIELYQYIGSSSWTESGATWANISQNEDEDDYIAYATADNNADTVFDITNLLKSWKNTPSKANQGFILRCVNETVDKAFYSSEYGTASYRPYVEITYYDLLPTSGSELPYEPELWDEYVEPICNCYSYMLNNQVYPGTNDIWLGQQPGEFAGSASSVLTEQGIYEGVLADDIKYKGASSDKLFRRIAENAVCPDGMYKVALVKVPNSKEYHWLRQDADGFWSHKNGPRPVTREDSLGARISNPREGYFKLDNVLEYTFVGFYAVCPWGEMFVDKTNINNIYCHYGVDGRTPYVRVVVNQQRIIELTVRE